MGRPRRLPFSRACAKPARVLSCRISRSNAAKTASKPAIARPAGVVRSSASVSDTKPTPRCSSSWRVASRSVTDRPQRSRRQTSTTSIPRRRAASSSFSRASRRAAPEFTSRTCRAIAQPRRVAYSPSPGSASPASAGHWWKRGHTGPPGTLSAASVPGQKRYWILLSEKPVSWAFDEDRSAWPPSILFGQNRAYSITRLRDRPAAPASRGSSMASTPTGFVSAPRCAAATP
jgi:hypothetical protein